MSNSILSGFELAIVQRGSLDTGLSWTLMVLEAINLWLTGNKFVFILRKKGRKTKKRTREVKVEKGNYGPPIATRNVFFF